MKSRTSLSFARVEIKCENVNKRNKRKMVKKKRGKCAKNNHIASVDSDEPTLLKNAPHSFVIQRGNPCPKLHDLTFDFRKIMEPFTATNLKERKKNKIKDFVSVSGTFHVANMCVFNRSTELVMMKIGRLPRGPTLVFKIHQFTLARDVISTQKRSFVEDRAFDNAPLAILNSFAGDGKHMKLMANTLQNMFPNINVGTVKLSSIRRCVLFSYNPTTDLIDFRHFAIRVQPVGVSKAVKKIITGRIPNLSKCEDIADFIERAGCQSDSEFEEEDGANQVTVSQPMKLPGTVEDGKSAIKLYELGPRMTLQLMKVEEGLFNGEILYHNTIVKSEEEKETIRKKIQQRKKVKEERSKEQEENKKRKEDLRVDHKNKSLAGMKRSADDFEEEDGEVVAEEDDADYYRQEVGEAPDEQLFTKGRPTKRAYTPKYGKAKKARGDDENGAKEKKPMQKSKFKTQGSAKRGSAKGGKGGSSGGRGGKGEGRNKGGKVGMKSKRKPRK